MEKNCRAYLKIESVSNTIVYYRCLQDMTSNTFCKDHITNSQELKDNFTKGKISKQSIDNL